MALASGFGQRVEVLVEVARFGVVKRESGAQGATIDYLSPVPSPFNYGCLPGTVGPDGDPIDVVLLGRRVGAGRRVVGVVVGCVDFIDDGLPDPKWVVNPEGRALRDRDRAQVLRFFQVYAVARGWINRRRGQRGETRCGGIEWVG